MEADLYIVVKNELQQHSLWFADRELPNGWSAAGFSGTREGCLEHIERVWTDIRPRRTDDADHLGGGRT